MIDKVVIWFKCNDRVSCILMKHAIDDITLSRIEDCLYQRLGLDENKVRLQLRFNRPTVRDEEEVIIYDDVDVCGYLAYIDECNRSTATLLVDVIARSEEPEERMSRQVSRAVKSSVGCNDGEEGATAITMYFPPVRDNEIEPQDGNVDISFERSDIGDVYVELPPVVESSHFIEEWEDSLGLNLHQEFEDKKTLLEVVDRGSFVNSFCFAIKRSEPCRLWIECKKEGCKWGVRASKIRNMDIFRIIKYTKMHTCSRASQSESSGTKRQCTPEIVASLLQEDFPGQMNTPTPRVIMGLVKTKLGVSISYSTARRGRKLAIDKLRGTPEESYKMIHSYLYELEKVNAGTVTQVQVDDNGKFKYLFIALGVSIEGFRGMRKVIIVDATFLKNGYGGVLVFAIAQDPNRHHYPIAYSVLDGENDASWTWFFQTLKKVIPDSSELVFISDRNARLIGAIANVYPKAHHGYCIWHMSQNVIAHASNTNKAIVGWKFMQCSKQYTVADFNREYSLFVSRFPSVARYLEESTVKEKWARCVFPGERYNIDTSNSVESMNSVFNEARKFSLIPMLDTILKTFSKWFSDRRMETKKGTIENKLVPYVENLMHESWAVADRLIVMAINTFEFNVVASDGKTYFVCLESKSCSCRVFDIEKYPCLHTLAAFIHYHKIEPRPRNIPLHELCSNYYWSELWALAYHRSILLVPEMSQWDVPDYIKAKEIIPPDRIIKTGRRKVKRMPSAGETRPRSSNVRRPRQRFQSTIYNYLGGDYVN